MKTFIYTPSKITSEVLRICYLIKRYGRPYLNKYKTRFLRKLASHNSLIVSKKRNLRKFVNFTYVPKYPFNLRIKPLI